MKTVLVVAGDYPYPPIHGGRIDTWNRIKVLKNLGYAVDLIVTSKKHEENSDMTIHIKNVVDNLYIANRKNRIIDVFSINPLQVESRKSLKYLNLERYYDYVILEGDYVGAILENNTLQYKHVVLRSHNNEIVYFKNLAESTYNIIRKLYYYTDYLKFKKYEPNLLKKIKNVMFVSFEEKQNYDALIQNLNTVFLPTNVDRKFKKQRLNSKTVVFIGSLFMDNNREGLQWYIKNIHNLVLNKIKDYRLLIAGNSNGKSIKWLYDLADCTENIEIIDTPENLDVIYAEGSVFINPMLHGAGVKLKTIEAVVNGLPVVSTTIGNEGTGLQNDKCIIVTNDIIEYANSIIRILEDDKNIKENLVANSQKFICNNYNTEQILGEYLDKLAHN